MELFHRSARAGKVKSEKRLEHRVYAYKTDFFCGLCDGDVGAFPLEVFPWQYSPSEASAAVASTSGACASVTSPD